MPRYFFNMSDGVVIRDHDGTELSGIEEARRKALAVSADTIRTIGDEFWNSPEWEIWVTDETGATVCSLRMLAKTPEKADLERT